MPINNLNRAPVNTVPLNSLGTGDTFRLLQAPNEIYMVLNGGAHHDRLQCTVLWAETSASGIVIHLGKDIEVEPVNLTLTLED